MLGDLDLIHMARDHALPHNHPSAELSSAGGEHPRLARLSLDSTLSMSSTTSTTCGSSPLSSSWGGFNMPSSPKASILMRQVSMPAAGGAPSTQPMDIPRRTSADYALLRRHTITGGSFPMSAGGVAAASAARVSESGVGAGGAQRLPMLVRSLSKGLSESLDFR